MVEAIQNFMHLKPFGGNSDEDVEQFIAQSTAAMAVQGVDAANKVAYVMLRLKGGRYPILRRWIPRQIGIIGPICKQRCGGAIIHTAKTTKQCANRCLNEKNIEKFI